MSITRQLRWLGSVMITRLILSWFSVSALATEPSSWSVRPWFSDDGLPDNDVTGIAQNSQGYLWLATQGGLALFDGVRFRELDLPTPSRSPHPLIRQLLQGNDALWLALEGGTIISLNHDRTNVFTTADGLPAYRPSSLAQARDGSVWIGFVDGSACRIARGKVTRYTAKSGLSGVGPCVLAADTQGEIWFAKAGTLSFFRDEKINYATDLPEGIIRLTAGRNGGLWILAGLKLSKFDGGKIISVATINSSAAGVSPSVVYEDHAGAVWVGTMAGGLFRMNGSNCTPVTTSYPDILSLAEDREGNLWAGTGGGGLNRLRPRVLELHNADDGLPFASIRSVCADATGIIWAAAQNGTLAKFENGRWQNLSADSNWAGTRVTCVTADTKGGVWVGTSHEGLRHWTGNHAEVIGRGDGLGGETVRALCTDREGALWISTESPNTVQRWRAGRFENIPRPDGSRTVRSIVQDQAGTIWLGTVDGFLLRVEGEKIVDASDSSLARRKPVRCLYAGPEGDLWIGYAGAGLGRWHDGKFSNLSTSRGLHDAYICGMMQDGGGGFWFSSDHGIFQVRQRELNDALDGKTASVRSVLFGREEGLPSLQGNFGYGPGFARSGDGKIWFPTRSGLVAINPEQTQPNHLVPPVLIERVLVDGATANLQGTEKISLPPRHRKIEIEFTALSFVAPENVAFRCKLEGWDEGWNAVPRGQRSVNYTRLPAGEYRLRVLACNNAGIWNETGAALAFTVEQFFWNTWWFRSLAVIFVSATVALAVRQQAKRKYLARLRKLEAEAALQKERARIAKDIHDELGANLTQISLLGKFTQHDLTQPDKARAHVEKIASIARDGVRSVDEIVWAVNPRNDTLSQLLDYAGQYAVDFLRAADIRCRIDFPEKIPANSLPADVRHGLFMVVKEALNNAVKHSGAKEILLRAEIFEATLTLNIEDDGRGFDSPKDNALADGLRNMQQRATELGGVCSIESQPGHGTKVRVQLQLP
jgi:signal transduction histidine kinase/ligand-binding sensor domain-containing protein